MKAPYPLPFHSYGPRNNNKYSYN